MIDKVHNEGKNEERRGKGILTKVLTVGFG